MPLARPALVSLGILLSVWTWNQFLLSIVLVDDPTNRTMAGALGAFQGQWGTNIPLLSAGSLLILVAHAASFHRLPAPFCHRPLARLIEGLKVHSCSPGQPKCRSACPTSGSGTFGLPATTGSTISSTCKHRAPSVTRRRRHHNATIGHAVSGDLRDWRVLPDALHPGAAG